MNRATPYRPPTSPEAGPSTRHEAPTAPAPATPAPDSSDPSSDQQKAASQKSAKLAFLDHLIRNFDIVVFCQLSILYYMDNSLFKFLLRALPHWFLFSPKPAALFPPSPTHPNNGPYLGPLLITNVLCILLHALFAPPAAGEAARGYLHGGMIIDFVGQASPVGRWKLLGLDLMVGGLQVVMMGLTVEKMALHGVTGAAVAGRAGDEGGRRGQDLDAEERGVLGEAEEGIEMEGLEQRGVGRTGGEEDAERDELLGGKEEGHPLDRFYEGGYMLVRLHLLETVRAEASGRMGSGRTTGATTTATDTGGRFGVGRFFPARFVTGRVPVGWARPGVQGAG